MIPDFLSVSFVIWLKGYPWSWTVTSLFCQMLVLIMKRCHTFLEDVPGMSDHWLWQFIVFQKREHAFMTFSVGLFPKRCMHKKKLTLAFPILLTDAVVRSILRINENSLRTITISPDGILYWSETILQRARNGRLKRKHSLEVSFGSKVNLPRD